MFMVVFFLGGGTPRVVGFLGYATGLDLQEVGLRFLDDVDDLRDVAR